MTVMPLETCTPTGALVLRWRSGGESRRRHRCCLLRSPCLLFLASLALLTRALSVSVPVTTILAVAEVSVPASMPFSVMGVSIEVFTASETKTVIILASFRVAEFVSSAVETYTGADQ